MNGEEANGSSGAPNLFESGVPIFISPYKLALLLLVKEFVLLSASAEDGELVKDEEQMAIFGHTRPQLASFLIAEVKALATDREKTLAQFIEAMAAYELDEIVDGLREQLGRLCQSPDEVYELFRRLSSLYEASLPGLPHIDKTSLLGIFMRRLHLEFDKMAFSALSRLYSSLVAYCTTDEEERFVLSPYEAEKLVHEEAAKIEEMIGRAPQHEIEQRIEAIKEIAPTAVGKSHYLSYLYHLHHREYDGAMDSLHAYFDTCMRDNEVVSVVDDPDDPSSAQLIRTKSTLPYAILNLVSTHYRFGHYEQALDAIHETVRVAQERNDEDCLAFALMWLCRLTEAQIFAFEENGMNSKEVKGSRHEQGRSARQTRDRIRPSTKRKTNATETKSADDKLKQLLERCVARAKELHNQHLYSLSSLALAKYNLFHATSRPRLPGLPSSTANMGTFPLRVKELIEASMSANMSNSFADLMNAGHFLKMGMWDFYGHKELAMLSSQIVLENYGDKAEIESTCAAYCHLAALHAWEGDMHGALGVLAEAHLRFPVGSARHHWAIHAAHILHEWFLRRCEYSRCQVLVDKAKAMAATNGDWTAAAEALHLSALLMIARGQLSEAFGVMNKLIAKCKKKNMEVQSIAYLLTLAQIHQKSGNAVAALTSVLSCLTQSENLNLDNLFVMSTVRLAEIHLQLGNAQKALTSLHSVLPQVMQHCPLHVKADTFLLMAKCHLYMLKPQEGHVIDVLGLLEKALACYRPLQDVDKQIETHYLMARVQHEAGLIEERNRSSAHFKRQLKRKQEAVRHTTDMLGLYHLDDPSFTFGLCAQLLHDRTADQ